jgi:hypothetical protein
VGAVEEVGSEQGPAVPSQGRPVFAARASGQHSPAPAPGPGLAQQLPQEDGRGTEDAQDPGLQAPGGQADSAVDAQTSLAFPTSSLVRCA